jgi:hypothetical protein
MRLVNTTNISDDKLREMFEFCAKPLGLDAMKVSVYDAERHNGFWGHSSRVRKEIAITTGKTKSFPYFLNRPPRIINSQNRWESYTGDDDKEYWRKKSDYVDKYRENPHIPMLNLTREEYMIHLFAHELRHQWQHKKRSMQEYTHTVRHLGSKSYFRRERDCDAYALRKVREWRQLHAVDIYKEQPVHQ